MALLVLILTFTILLILNVPVGFCLGIAALAAFIAAGDIPAFLVVAQQMATGIDSFALLAIPFFILSGLLMGQGGLAQRLIDFANVVVGGFRGGLAFVNILTCMMFGAISGSAAAAVSSIGGFMIPLMNKMGYHRDFNASVTVTAATTGLLIPPSNVMIVYSLATGGACSIAALFIAGVIPGILVGLALMVVAGIISAQQKYGSEDLYKTKEIVIRAISGVFCFAAPLYLLWSGNLRLPAPEQLKENASLKEIIAGGNKILLLGAGLIILSAVIFHFLIKSMRKSDSLRICGAGLIGLLLIPLWFIRNSYVSYHMNQINPGQPFLSNILSLLYMLVMLAVLAYYCINVSSAGFLKFIEAVPALLLIIIVLGGILGGIFTATEASAIAVLYSFILAVFFYKQVKWKDIPGILLNSAVTTAVVMLLIATSMAMSWFLACENIPQNISAFLLGLTGNQYILLLIINLLLLMVGMFMDMTPAVLIFTPIFLPVIKSFGMHPLHFGIVMIMNLCIGLCTPPVGTCLFLGCGIAQTTVTKIMKHIVPFCFAMIAVLMICTYMEWPNLWLPRILKLISD